MFWIFSGLEFWKIMLVYFYWVDFDYIFKLKFSFRFKYDGFCYFKIFRGDISFVCEFGIIYWLYIFLIFYLKNNVNSSN